MKLRLSLLLFCLLGIGLFGNAQDKEKEQSKSKVENAPPEIPVMVTGTKKITPQKPPTPPKIEKAGKPLPPAEVTKFTPPKIVKDTKVPPPPPTKPKTVPVPEKPTDPLVPPESFLFMVVPARHEAACVLQ